MMNKTDVSKRKIGVNFNTSGYAEVLIWAPHASDLVLRIGGHNNIPLNKTAYGYWQLTTNELKPGMTYDFVSAGIILPDVTSLHQPAGVHKSSLAVDLNYFKWTDKNWFNPSMNDYIIYELHAGTFTPEGTFAGIESRLDYLKELGITAIEIMPVAEFPGSRNWGYDGVFPFAVHHSYGGAAGLQQLVNACHQKGLAVVLDVVYNHIGPEGNYFDKYGPYFTDKYKTPWGNAINFDDAGCDAVRRYFTENVLMWFRDFHIDALRLDAVHAIKDFSPKHILQEMKEYVDELMQQTGRQHYLIIECDLNDNRFIDPLEKRGFGMNAQWTDEFHHALRVTAGEKQQGYYADFEPLTSLAESFEHAYVYHGQYSAERDKSFGTDPVDNPGSQFIVFSQNHDQVGNRMLGERSGALFSFEMQKLMAATVFISPFIPMLFMGEEYSEPNPFLYFVSHTDPELVEAVRKGRSEEFAAFHSEGETPDPQAEETFIRSKLQWKLVDIEPHKTMLRYYQTLIALRKSVPAFETPNRKNSVVVSDASTQTLIVSRFHEEGSVACFLNFSDSVQSVNLSEAFHNGEKIFDSAKQQWNGPGASIILVQDSPAIRLQPQSISILKQNV